MTSAADREQDEERFVHCGCCGAAYPRRKVHELGNSPGVFVCTRCAANALIRLNLPQRAVARLRALDMRELKHRLGHRLERLKPRRGHERPGTLHGATPILFCTDVDRTSTFFARLGFAQVERYDDGYLLLAAGGDEVHFTTRTISNSPGEMFVHVDDASALWTRLSDDQVPGLGPVIDQPWGLCEFVVTDPDGNRIRLGSQPYDRRPTQS